MKSPQLLCPRCKTSPLRPAMLDASLACHTCTKCGGSYLRMQDYLNWKASAVHAEVTGELELDTRDHDEAMPCPEAGRIMLKYEVSKNSAHRIDYSRYANAVWLDAGEWNLLKLEGLTEQLNEIFTDAYQAALRAAQVKESLDDMYRYKFGDAAYEDLKGMRSWLVSQGQRSDMLSFLMAQDPYTV